MMRLLALLAVALVLAAAPANAHWDGPPRTVAAATAGADPAAAVAPEPGTPAPTTIAPALAGRAGSPAWLALLALGAGSLLVRRRRPTAVALVLVLSVFAFETALHSVHHLADAANGAPCAVASAPVNHPAATIETASVSLPVVSADVVSASAQPLLAAIDRAPASARAPPVPTA